MPHIRDATAADAEALLAIYRPFVTDTTVSFELEPPPVEEFAQRIASAQSRWAWLVAEEGGGVAGYAYATSFRPRAAYQWSVEMSAYLDESFRGKGIARALYERLIGILVAKGYCTAYAGITLPNEASVRFHQALGFTAVGVFQRAGRKFGAWHDVSWWQRPLQDRPPEDE
ncbi:MAG TPA: arsinothricin resistance N-acetyltransferase ArsN1 family B [Vicinamibacteria bacterium]|nr:arsinothricin resistance N-acetyltransferase ArsN1 family B [Vicinamibacteria bacterium]